MTFDKAIQNHLLSDPYFQPWGSDRILAGGVAPEGTIVPYIVFYRISRGQMPGVPFRRPRYQFSCYATTYDEARTIAEKVVEIIDRLKTVMGNKFPVHQGSVVDDQDFYEPDSKLYHVPVDVIFLYQTHTVIGGVATKIE